ncbi:MAG: hypothetical protein Sapg2KO_22040 [Saprospiraceae bacterium]
MNPYDAKNRNIPYSKEIKRIFFLAKITTLTISTVIQMIQLSIMRFAKRIVAIILAIAIKLSITGKEAGYVNIFGKNK